MSDLARRMLTSAEMVELSRPMLDLQELVLQGCPDCVWLERTHDPMVGWVWQLGNCSLEAPIQRRRLDDLADAWRRHLVGETVEARDDEPPVRLLQPVDRHPLFEAELRDSIAQLIEPDHDGDTTPEELAADRETARGDADDIIELLHEHGVLPVLGPKDVDHDELRDAIYDAIAFIGEGRDQANVVVELLAARDLIPKETPK